MIAREYKEMGLADLINGGDYWLLSFTQFTIMCI